MKKAVRWMSLLLSAALAAGLASGCGDADTTSGDTGSGGNKYELIEDLGGYEFTVADTEDSLFYSPTPGKDELNDAIVERIKRVEQSYNCKIKLVPTDQIQQFDIVMPRILSGEKYADIVCSTYYNAGKFISAGLMTDLATLPNLKLDQPYWEQQTTSATKFGEKVYMAAPIYYRNQRSVPVVFFNKRLVEELKLEDPYELVKNKQWTWDNYIKLARAATKDLDGNGIMDWSDQWGISAADPYGDHAVAMFNASGLKMLDLSEQGKVEYAMNNSQTVDVLTKLKQMILKDNVMVVKEDNSEGHVWVDQFTSGKALFLQHTLFTVEQVAAMDDDFGVLPLPMGPYADDYICTMGHNTLTMGIPINNPDIDKVSKIANALAEFSQPEVDAYKNTIKNRYLRDDESRELFDKIVTNYMAVDYAPLCWLSNTDIDAGTRMLVSNCVRNLNTEPASSLAAVAEACAIAVNDFWNK